MSDVSSLSIGGSLQFTGATCTLLGWLLSPIFALARLARAP